MKHIQTTEVKPELWAQWGERNVRFSNLGRKFHECLPCCLASHPPPQLWMNQYLGWHHLGRCLPTCWSGGMVHKRSSFSRWQAELMENSYSNKQQKQNEMSNNKTKQIYWLRFNNPETEFIFVPCQLLTIIDYFQSTFMCNARSKENILCTTWLSTKRWSSCYLCMILPKWWISQMYCDICQAHRKVS